MNIPTATYRVQLNQACGFRRITEILPYLSALGISTVYASPVLQAVHGSTHGYDIVDPTRLNGELGTESEFTDLVRAVKEHGLTWLQDIVPNHMAFHSDNQLLMDILENGEDSHFFRFFDIDWEHMYENMKGRLLAPFLGKLYAEVLEHGEISLVYDEKGLSIKYYQLQLPLRISSYVDFLQRDLDRLEQLLTPQNPDLMKLLGEINLLKNLAAHEGDADQSEQVRHAKKMLWKLYVENEAIKNFIDTNLTWYNGKPGDPSSYDALDALILAQRFRLSFWKVAAEEINYRRFFTVNDLISLKVEDEPVFQYTHRLIFKLIEEGCFQGLRIDHIDGLKDPEKYLKRLREHVGDRYIVVEKILAAQECIPAEWPIQGTTGYDFLRNVNGLFCLTENTKAMTSLYQQFSGMAERYERLVADRKRLIVSKHLAGNIDNLAHLLKKISSKDRYGRDITLYGLRRALVELMTFFPVYRTYINEDSLSEHDKTCVMTAVNKAKRALPSFSYELDFIQKFMLLQCDTSRTGEKNEWLPFVMSFQQYTGPLMAKGFEDTVLYTYNRLISLNEVGGAPERFGNPTQEFHAFNQGKIERRDHSLNATSTHDVKRGEDTRCRISVLSEMAGEWAERITEWSEQNKKYKHEYGEISAPDTNDEYFFYQSMVGAYPWDDSEASHRRFIERLQAYCIKSIRESKRYTAWIKPDNEYEDACIRFIERIFTDPENNRFLGSFRVFQKKTAFYGMFNSLTQTLLKIASPGVPDFYQGTDLWELTFVDPDNRGTIDFEPRKNMLERIRAQQHRLADYAQELLKSPQDGCVKLFLIHRALQARKAHPALFLDGTYKPLTIEGPYAENIIGFSRTYGNDWAICLAPRFLTKLISDPVLPLGKKIWKDSSFALPDKAPQSFTDAITGRTISIGTHAEVGSIFESFPGALLIASSNR